MPSPKNRLKLTGDTHLPDVGYEIDIEEDEVLVVAVPEEEALFESAPRGRRFSRPRGYLEAAREQVRSRPVAALTGAFVLGLLLARV